jgi:glycosyltransferase involved in cell wall biosynthesis
MTVSYIPSGQVEKLDELPPYDMAFATLWTTAFYVGQYIKASSYFYFIQDFESLFYPASTEYQLADLTYEFGYFGIFNTPGLKDAVLSQHDMTGVAFSPGVDRAVYYPPAHPQNVAEYPIRVVFYGRPAVPRNLFELGVDTLREMKRVFNDKVDIVVVGSPHAPVRLDFESRWLGYLPYKETGKLYRSAHVGIALMATPHPSYLPIQLMACGTVPLAIQSPYTHWLLDDGVNSICSRPTALDMLARFSDAVADAEQFARLREGAIATAQRYDWTQAVNDTLSQILTGSRDTVVPRSRSWERAAVGTDVAE